MGLKKLLFECLVFGTLSLALPSIAYGETHFVNNPDPISSKEKPSENEILPPYAALISQEPKERLRYLPRR